MQQIALEKVKLGKIKILASEKYKFNPTALHVHFMIVINEKFVF